MLKFSACWPSSFMRKFAITILAIINEFLNYLHNFFFLAREGGLEPTTLGFGDRCSTN